MTDQDAIPAATLVVWNDRPEGPEILVVERSARMAFAAGAIVFPGGRVDPSDRELAEDFGYPNEAAKVTAIRETIEETGVAPAITGAVDAQIGLELQDALHGGVNFADLLSEHGQQLDLDALTAFAEFALEIERIARAEAPAGVGTIGVAAVGPGSRNTVPGTVDVGPNVVSSVPLSL